MTEPAIPKSPPAIAAPSPSTSGGVNAGLLETLTARWKECRDASVDGKFSLQEKFVLAGRAGGLKEAIDAISTAESAQAATSVSSPSASTRTTRSGAPDLQKSGPLGEA